MCYINGGIFLRQDKTKILFVVTTYPTAKNFVFPMMAELSQSIWSPIVVSSPPKNESPISNKLLKGIRYVPIQIFRNPHPLMDLWSLIRLLRLIIIEKPGLIIGATPKGGLLAMFAGFLGRVPIRIYEIWGLRYESEKGIKRAIYKLFELTSISLSTNLFANSHSLANEVSKMEKSKKVHVLGEGSSHGVDTFFYNAEIPFLKESSSKLKKSLNIQKETFVISYVGRIHEDKGITALISAVRALSEKGLNIKLLMAGPIEMKIDQLHLNTDPVIYLGSLDDIRSVLLASDLLCLLTVREGFPNVVLEAAALKIPAVTTDATGAIDSVVDGVTGWIIPVGSSEQFMQTISHLYENRNLVKAAGLHAHTRVMEYFTKEMISRLRDEKLIELSLSN